MDRPEMHPGFWLENLKEEDSFDDIDRGGKIIFKLILNK
jgi:hypothetical protein